MKRKQSTFSQKYRGTVVASVLLVAAILVLVWGIIPAIRNIRVTLTQVNALRKETASLQSRLTFLDSLSEEEMRKNLVELLLGVPFGRTIPTILSTVLDVSSTTQVNLTDVGVDSSNPLATASGNITQLPLTQFVPSSPEIPVNVGVTGDKDKIRAFLDTIQKVRRMMGISKITATYQEDGTIDALVTVNGYSLPMLEGGIATDSALVPFTSEEDELVREVSNLPTYGNDLPQAAQKPVNPKPDPFAKF